MSAGKPVIATAHPGNLGYMDDAVAYLVRGRAGEIPAVYRTYWSGPTWLEPDVAVAAELLRHVYERPEEAEQLGRAASKRIRERHSPEATGAFVRARLAGLRERPPRAGVPAGAATEQGPGPVDRAAGYLAHGPANGWDVPSRLGPVGSLGRRAVRRLLRPYTRRHAELDAAVVDALRELERHQLAVEAKLDALLDDGSPDSP
jgi:hypothetical protein